mmetsp:Transcript_24495/g.45823  ORF Transcript_24495/g.45823 Transcript_24495/m.45823 type:complete len:80 (-) Transcript_24495:837-1076(-)
MRRWTRDVACSKPSYTKNSPGPVGIVGCFESGVSAMCEHSSSVKVLAEPNSPAGRSPMLDECWDAVVSWEYADADRFLQ